MRKSLKRLRDPEAFAKGKRELEALQKQEDQGKIDLIILMNLDLRLIPRFPMLGKNLRASSNCLPCDMAGSMC